MASGCRLGGYWQPFLHRAAPSVVRPQRARLTPPRPRTSRNAAARSFKLLDELDMERMGKNPFGVSLGELAADPQDQLARSTAGAPLVP